MKGFFMLAAAIALLCLGSLAQATIIDTVPVGNPNNAADTRYETPGYGSVAYAYNVGKYEVTAAQYADFLNKGRQVRHVRALQHGDVKHQLR